MGRGESKEGKGGGGGGRYSLATAKDFTKELVAATPSQRNWKGILIALLVICAVLGLIIFSIYLLLPPDEGPRVKGRKVTLEDVTSSHFLVSPFNGSWISATELLFRDYLGGLSLLNVATSTLHPFAANTTFRQLDAHKFFVSPDRRLILFAHEDQPVWQNSFRAKYTVYDIDNQYLTKVTPFPDGDREQEQTFLQWAGWVPGTTSLIFVYENDIYYKPVPSGSVTYRVTTSGRSEIVYNGIPDWLYEAEILKSNSAIWMSSDGNYLVYASFNDSQVGQISYHWYEESQSYPNLRTLRYPKAGTTNPTVTLFWVKLKSNQLRNTVLKPPIGVDSSDYYVTGVSWVTPEIVAVIWMNRRQNVSTISTCRSPYFTCQEIFTVKNTGTGWLDYVEPPFFSKDGKSCILRLPWRDGEAGYFHHVVWVDLSTRKQVPITRGPFEVTKIVAWDQDSQYIYFIAAPHGSPGQRHLYRASEKSSNSTVVVAPLCLSCADSSPSSSSSSSSSSNSSSSSTNSSDNNSSPFPPPPPSKTPIKKRGKYQQHSSFLREELIELPDDESWVESKEKVDSLHSGSTMDAYVVERDASPSSSSVVSDNASSTSTSTSSPISKSRKKRMLLKLPSCLYNKVTFSSDARYFVRECEGPGVPTVTLHSAPFGRLMEILDNNTALKAEVADLGLPLARTFFVEVGGGESSYKAPVRLYLPPGLREDEEFRFPLVLFVNGAPGSQLVSEKWSLSWNAFLVSQKNYILAEVDGRGSGYQGENVRHSIYRRLGTYEVTDQIDAIRYLVNHLHYIDKGNMAVWGWGYGGYVTANILAKDEKEKDKRLFRCGISVAPITKWEFYDSAFTERFMGTPNFTDNYRGYEEADLTRLPLARDLADKNLLIIHGTADKRVHYQHTLQLTKAMIKEGNSFAEQIYPDEGHDLKGALHHLYMTMEAFIDSHFDNFDWEDYEKANFLGIRM